MRPIHRHDFLEIGAQAPELGGTIDYVREIDVNGLWRLTMYIASKSKTWLILEGIEGNGYFEPFTGVGAYNPTEIMLGGAYWEGRPVPMEGIIKVRFLGPGTFILKREWVDCEV